MTTVASNDLREILEDRLRFSRDLVELSQRQRALIDGDDYPALMGILAQKQRILGRFEELKLRHPDLAHRWAALQRTGDDAEIRTCSALVAETERLFAELVQLERLGTDRIVERRAETQRQLREIAHGSIVQETYRDTLAPSTHRHLDLGR